jgi:hypothetical protein
MAKKYRYRIEGGRYGGECAIGTVTEEFVQYWLPIIEEKHAYDTFVPHVLSLSEWDDEQEDLDLNSPSILEDSNDIPGWYEVDDVEHINAAYADGGFFVSQIPADGSDDWDYDENEVECDGYWLRGREGGYISTEEEECPSDCTPVMVFMSVEKGGFATWFVDTDEPFDENKLVMSVNETHMGEFIEDVWYDKELLEEDMDQNSTMGKSYEAAVGWINNKWRDQYVSPEDFKDEDMDEYWEEYERELEEREIEKRELEAS